MGSHHRITNENFKLSKKTRSEKLLVFIFAGFGGFSGNFSDIFDEFFGDVMGGGSQRKQNRGADLRSLQKLILKLW